MGMGTMAGQAPVRCRGDLCEGLGLDRLMEAVVGAEVDGFHQELDVTAMVRWRYDMQPVWMGP